MTNKEKILEKLLKENKITFEEMLILQQKEVEIKYIEKNNLDWIQPNNPFKPYTGTPDWTVKPEYLPRYNYEPSNFIAFL